MTNEDLKTALGIEELPVGSPEPSLTPPEGVILPVLEADGWTRKYLVRTTMGADGRPRRSRVRFAEIPPLQGHAAAAPTRALSVPAPQSPSSLEVPGNRMVTPSMVQLSGNPRRTMGQAFPIGGGTLPAGRPSYPGDFPAAPKAPTQAPAGEAPKDEPVCPEGPIQLKDGSFLAPDDPLTFAQLCELMPVVAEALEVVRKNRGGQGGRLGPVSVVGGFQGAPAAVPGMNPFGQAQGPSGGGGGFGWMGGGGAGPRGPQGAQGSMGLGGLSSLVVKEDGDYTAGPGSFTVVPGTAINFTSQVAGVAHFFAAVTTGKTNGSPGFPQCCQIGMRVDGVDYPLATRSLYTFVSDVGEFLLGQNLVFGLYLAAGAHTVELVIRGLSPGEFGSGLGISVSVCATPQVPLRMSVVHS